MNITRSRRRVKLLEREFTSGKLSLRGIYECRNRSAFRGSTSNCGNRRACDAIHCTSLINSLLSVCEVRFPDFPGPDCTTATDAYWTVAATDFSRTGKVAAILRANRGVPRGLTNAIPAALIATGKLSDGYQVEARQEQFESRRC